MFVSVKESRIENNRSFYGCFYLGSFDSGQSLTIANALRRTLLTECTGLSIISVKIDNVAHEYSTLPGVRDSVLDVILNFKEIILKKKKNFLGGPQGYQNKGLFSIYQNVGSTFFKPVIGYLKMKGPGVIRAKDLNLPPFVECVDPTQYIATLADDGYLSLKLVIMEGKNYYIHKRASLENSPNEDTLNQKSINSNGSINKAKTSPEINNKFNPNLEFYNDDNDFHFWTITQKREKLLKQLKNILETSKRRKGKVSLDNSNSNYENQDTPLSTNKKDLYSRSDIGTKEFTFQEDREYLNEFWEGRHIKKKTPKMNYSNNALYGDSKQLNIDAVFNPVTKVNYIIEGYENYVVESYNDRLKAIENLTAFLDSSIFLKTNLPFLKKTMFPRDRAQAAETNLENNGYNSDKNLDSRSQTNLFLQNESTFPPFNDRLDKKPKKIKYINNEIINNLDQDLSSEEFLALNTSEGFSHYKGIGIASDLRNTDFPETLSKDFENLEPCLNISQKEIIILEVWTNGSIHPRDALFMAFRSLSSTFNTHKIKISDPIFSDSTSYKRIIENF